MLGCTHHFWVMCTLIVTFTISFLQKEARSVSGQRVTHGKIEGAIERKGFEPLSALVSVCSTTSTLYLRQPLAKLGQRFNCTRYDNDSRFHGLPFSTQSR